MSAMPVNKKEGMIFTFLMVFVMASVMTAYNVMCAEGFSFSSLQKAWLIFPISFLVAFLVEWVVVSKTAHILMHKLLQEKDPLPKKILISALCFVVQMVFIMSVIGTAISAPFDAQ